MTDQMINDFGQSNWETIENYLGIEICKNSKTDRYFATVWDYLLDKNVDILISNNSNDPNMYGNIWFNTKGVKEYYCSFKNGGYHNNTEFFENVKDENLISLLQYYQLTNELKTVK